MPSARVDQAYTERSSTLKERAEQRAKSLISLYVIIYVSFPACLGLKGPLLLSVRYLLCSCISRHAVLTPCHHIE